VTERGRGRGRFSVVDHTADTGIEAEADSLAGLLEAAARGFIHIVFGGPGSGGGEEIEEVFEEDSFEDLVVEVLRSMLMRVEVEGMRLHDVEVPEAEEKRARVRFRVSPLGKGEEVELHVKAVTYHDLALRKRGDLYSIRVIFDI